MTSVSERLGVALAGRYRIEREVARGGMGTVFLARDLKHDRLVALKILQPEVASALGAARFLREIEVASHLSHPNILPVHDSGNADGLLYYVMPYVEGESLRSRLAREKQLSLDDALRIAREVLDALEYAHGQGVVHRDIKPENILLHADHAVVCDFGVARAVGTGAETLTGTGVAIGSPQYMSPEQAGGDRDLDGRSDLYSLGCVLFEMLAGQAPFTGLSADSVVRQHLAATPVPLRVLRPGVPRSIARAVERALEKTPADRFATASQFSAALIPGALPRRRVRRAAWIGLAAVVAAGAIATVVISRALTPDGLDPNLIAVAPFDVLAAGQELWREGMVDVLSRQLDGAGPLRTVPPTIVVRRWSGRVDPASAVALGQRTGAGLAIIGQLVGTGVDSLRLTATLLDVSTGRTIREIEIRDLTAQVDRMSDSLTVVVLSELAQSRPIGSLRLTSLGSTSVPALKAYLQGEQFYRRAAWDSALTSYERAVNLDSMFAPAIRRLGDAHSQVAGHGCFIACPEWPLLMRAGARNHGLAPRESTLIAIDSVYATLRSQDVSPGLLRRLFVMLTAATRSYPNDPEVWYAMGEAQNHLGLWPAAAVTGEQALQSFEKSIALDSGFAPAYPDAIILALYERDPPEAQRLAARYLEIAPRGGDAAVLRLVRRLSRSDRAGLREAAAAMDTVPIQVLEGAAYWFLGLPDSAETVLRIIRAYVARPDAEGDADEGVAYALASRGHVREAYARIGSRFPHRFVDLALTGLVTGDAARAVFDEWLRGLRTHRSGDLQGALPWWASRGDTASLQQFIQRADSEAARDPSPWGWSNVSFDRLAARAYLTLARRDSTEALAQFMVLPDTICLECLLSAKLTTVRLLVARGRFREAAVLLDLRLERAGFLPGPLQPEVWVLERGRVNDRLGNRAKAIRAYRYIAEVWRNADPELQPYVQEARTALRRLGAGPER